MTADLLLDIWPLGIDEFGLLSRATF